MEYKQFYWRKLPHLHSPGATLFVTFRLAGTIPTNVLAKWKSERLWLEKEDQRIAKLVENNADEKSHSQQQRLKDFSRRWFAKFEDILHKEESGLVWLKDQQIANLVAESLQYRNGKIYKLVAFCIMSNHVHVVFTPLLNEKSLTEVAASNPLRYESCELTLGAIMQTLKGYTAHEANKILNRTGQFWEVESYDHQVRNAEELGRIVKYVLNNPVKAGLVKDWRDWKWNWLAEK